MATASAVQGCVPHGDRQISGCTFAADVSRETLSLTTLGALQSGARVNLEPALRAGDPLGGHLVSGHVDGVAQVVATARGCALPARDDRQRRQALARYLAPKGLGDASDGVSLTVN